MATTIARPKPLAATANPKRDIAAGVKCRLVFRDRDVE
jgi:hypothetical protein